VPELSHGRFAPNNLHLSFYHKRTQYERDSVGEGVIYLYIHVCVYSVSSICVCVRARLYVCVWITVTYSTVCATGPDHWAEKFPECGGKLQNPVDIEEHLVRMVRLPPLAFHGFNRRPLSSNLTNNGHTGESNPALLGGK